MRRCGSSSSLHEKYGECLSVTPCAEDDSDNWNQATTAIINNTWNANELEWQVASAPGANDGHLGLWVNGILSSTLASLDNDTQLLKNANLGVLSVSTGVSGTLYFEDFEARRGS